VPIKSPAGIPSIYPRILPYKIFKRVKFSKVKKLYSYTENRRVGGGERGEIGPCYEMKRF